MIEKAEALRGVVVDVVAEVTGLTPVFLSPPELSPEGLPEGDHAVVLMRTEFNPDSLLKAELIVEFSIWIRYRRGQAQPLPDFERRRVIEMAAILEKLQSSRVAFRAVGEGYLPKPTVPWTEAEAGTLGGEWADSMVGFSVRTEVDLV